MKKILLLFTLLVVSASARADTIDHWTVYLNDSVIGQFNAGSEDLGIEIDGSKITADDVISVRYRDDTPCMECGWELFVRDEKDRKLRITEGNEHGGKLSLNLLDLVEFGKKNGSERYDFYYWEKSSSGPGPWVLVLQMKVR